MIKKITVILSLIMIVAAVLPACGQPASADVIKSGKTRVTSPSVSQSDMDALVEGDNAFAFDLYHLLKEEGDNIFFSPYSISMALAMTYAGAKGTTEQQMADTLHYSLPQEHLHPAFNNLDAILASRGEGAKGKDGKGFRLNIVNAIWGQKGYEFLSGYLDLLAENYGAGLQLMDFISAPDNCRKMINQWVSDQTEDRIRDLIPEGAINTLTRLVLTNAIYFNAAWADPFEKMLTKPDVFHLEDGTEVQVPMMHQVERLNYLDGDNFQSVELPYDGHELSMLIVLPDAGKFDQVENSLDAGVLRGIIGNLAARQIGLSMPSFEFESSFGLNKVLSHLGMPIAFSNDADFSGMTGNKELRISDVIHKAFISTDESGTEAAAATAVVMEATAMPAKPLELKIDRPFIFLIRDIETEAVLFIGRIMNPQQ